MLGKEDGSRNDSLPLGGNGVATRVKHTGIALVHEGEIILPAAGSEAQAEQVLADSRQIIHYHFPVIIEHVPEEPTESVEDKINHHLEVAAQSILNSDIPV